MILLTTDYYGTTVIAVGGIKVKTKERGIAETCTVEYSPNNSADAYSNSCNNDRAACSTALYRASCVLVCRAACGANTTIPYLSVTKQHTAPWAAGTFTVYILSGSVLIQ